MICRRWMVALVVAVGLLFCIQSSVSARTIRVKLNGAQVGDGATWASALRSLSDALDAAVAGDEVWVGMGRYTGSFTIKAGVSVFGGFSGFEEHRSQRNWLANETWLYGDGERRVVVFDPGSGPDTVLDGVAVCGGSAQRRRHLLCIGSPGHPGQRSGSE